jgi:hypothetical protein
VIVLPVEVLVMFTAPIVNLVPFPAKAIVLEELAVTTPVPRLRLFAAEFVDDPKASPSVHVQAWFPAFTTAEPLVLLIVAPVPARERAPDPSALLLLMFKVPAVRVTPPDAAELFPLKVNVPAVTKVFPPYVLSPARVISPVPTLVRALALGPLIAEPIVILPVPPM